MYPRITGIVRGIDLFKLMLRSWSTSVLSQCSYGTEALIIRDNDKIKQFIPLLDLFWFSDYHIHHILSIHFCYSTLLESDWSWDSHERPHSRYFQGSTIGVLIRHHDDLWPPVALDSLNFSTWSCRPKKDKTALADLSPKCGNFAKINQNEPKNVSFN